MNTRSVSMIVGLLLCLVTVLAAPQGAAAATAACTNIGNTATVNFNVGGAAQAAVSAPTNTITVGNKVDVIVTTTDASPGPSVVPNQAGALLHYTITNNGNANQRYRLSAIDLATGVTTSVFSGNNTVTDVVLVSAGTATTGDAGGGSLITTATITAGGTLNVTISATIAAPPLTNNTYDAFALRAQTLKVDGATVEADSASSTIDSSVGTCSAAIVLGDGAGTDDATGAKDGTYSARSAYHVQLTTLTVTKTSAPVWDPFNLAVNPRAIPGAIMEYYVTITNSGGSSDAQNVAITDTLTGTLTPVDPFTNADCAACAGACIEHPAATFTCAGSWAGQTLSSTDATNLVSGATTTFVYQATIN